MKIKTKKSKMLLQKGKKLTSFFVIALFSVLFINPINTFSASFKYKDFNWDTFSEAQNEYWEGYCNGYEDEKEKAKCEDHILKAQKKFYKKLYKLLAKYEAAGLFIDDNIILETVFIDMDPQMFSDDGKEYKEEWESNSGVYTVDSEDVTDEDVEESYTSPENYYENEKDTLKTLVSNMKAYSTSCYGIYGKPTVHKLKDGSTYESCDDGGVIMEIPARGRKCADTLAGYEYGFWEYYSSKWAYAETIPTNKIMPFLKRWSDDSRYVSCKAAGGNYKEGSTYVYNDDKHVSTDKYFDFLSYNIYFDKKAHLQERFKETILKPAGVKCMTDDVCDDSLESKGLYTEYEGEIIKVRQEIIEDIIEILKNYGIDISYNQGDNPNFIEKTEAEAARKSYYWPIGSDETEVRDGVLYADKEPASTDVVSYEGIRKDPITGEDEYHYGIDISGVEGKTNVIAVYDGEVIQVVSNCQKGDYECNEGYGNMVILSHANGDYTVYAHMAQINSAIRVGASVKKGQVLGTVGATGKTKSSVLHYELREGGNDISFSTNPLNNTSPDNPRPLPASGDFSVHSTSLTKEEFVNKMHSYCNKSSCSSSFMSVFVLNAEKVYDVSIASNVNPELVVIRAINEGMSPGGNSHNYWGIGCYNGAGKSACKTYGSLEDGIRGFANTVSKYNTVSEMMSKYAYIGKYWYNPGSWSLGGCKYFPYISQYMSAARSSTVSGYCSGGACTNSGGDCKPTTSEDQTAYATWQVNNKMTPLRYNIFGL